MVHNISLVDSFSARDNLATSPNFLKMMTVPMVGNKYKKSTRYTVQTNLRPINKLHRLREGERGGN